MQDNSKIENIDFVICQICNLHAKGLGKHITSVHKITIDEYKNNYSHNIISECTKNKYIELGKTLGVAKLNKFKENSDYKEILGKAVSESILNSPKEIQRRSYMMKQMNDEQWSKEEYREGMSELAKKTSAREDVQEQRSANLKKWRDENPEEFYRKCTSKMLDWIKENPDKVKKFHKNFIISYQSYPEKLLFNIISVLDGFSFKKNQFVKSKKFKNKSNKKQVDMADKKQRIYIEFDGPTHFKPIFGEEKLELTKNNDLQLETHVLGHKKWILIRVGHDQFIRKANKDNSYFLPECLEKVIKILNEKIPGLYKIGEVYNNG